MTGKEADERRAVPAAVTQSCGASSGDPGTVKNLLHETSRRGTIAGAAPVAHLGRHGLWSHRACLLHSMVLALSAWLGSCVTPSIAHLEVVHPFRFHLQYAPAWFGTIVLPPGRVTAEVKYAGDACETLLGSYSVRQKIALVDRGKCSFVQKAVHAEQAGAIAVIIANDSNEYFIMTDDGTRRQVRLHSFLISKEDGDRIKSNLPCAVGQTQHCDAEATRSVNVAFGLGFQTRAHYKLH